jgi:DNA-directed RNA polymerase subunit H (RpoH/RPB5)
MEQIRLENVRRTILEMFEQRGYTDIDSSEDNRILATKSNGDQICAYSHIIQKLNVGEIKTYIALLQTLNIPHCILVYDGVFTPAVKSIMEHMPSLNLNIELFSADNLQFNVTKHVLVPTHILLDKNEANEFKKKYGKKLPVILRSDPIAKFYDYHRDDIIKIVRRDGHVMYRVVK